MGLLLYISFGVFWEWGDEGEQWKAFCFGAAKLQLFRLKGMTQYQISNQAAKALNLYIQINERFLNLTDPSFSRLATFYIPSSYLLLNSNQLQQA